MRKGVLASNILVLDVFYAMAIERDCIRLNVSRVILMLIDAPTTMHYSGKLNHSYPRLKLPTC
jgi:hypothetical protein